MAAQTRTTILVTRPARAGARLVASLRDRLGADWPLVESPLLDILLLTPTPGELDRAEQADELIFTSENGVEGLSPWVAARGRRAWCVGGRTGRAAQAAGYAVEVADGDAVSLRALIKAASPVGRMIHARGRHIVAPLATQLSEAGLRCDEVTVYDQIERQLSAQARDLLAGKGPVIVPLFSPRSARIFARAAAGCQATLWLAALSPAVAEAAAPLAAARIEVAAQPDAAHICAAMLRLLDGA